MTTHQRNKTEKPKPGSMTGTDCAGGQPRELKASAVEDKIFELLALRQAGATICPSEVARVLAVPGGPWRELMPQIRDVASALVRNHRLSVTRRGVPVDPAAPGGPIRLGLPPR